MAAVDAEVLEGSALKYFSRTNHLNKRIISEEKTFIKHLGNTWNDLPIDRRDDLLNLLFVEDEVRKSFLETWSADIETHKKDDNSEIQESFPRLIINSGQKINVDFENDLWTWRDEHSGPFSWMSRSQQDLTLADLEPDVISKPQSKTLKVDSESEDALTKQAQKQFSDPSNCWCRDIIDEFRRCEESISPSVSLTQSVVKLDSPLEEVNPAFQGSCDNLSSSSSPAHDVVTKDNAKNEEINGSAAGKKSKVKDRRSRSPSPKKIPRSSSFKKSGTKLDDRGEEKLIIGNEAENEEGRNVFSNPVMESEWSKFVGDDSVYQSGVVQTSAVTAAPGVMTMDRGGDSPYRGDQDRLISPAQSPVQTKYGTAQHPSHVQADWSAESTPDHNTHLLKGMQTSPGRGGQNFLRNEDISYPSAPSDLSIRSAQLETADVAASNKEEEDDEILKVEVAGESITVTTENKRDSDIPTTGFDFLDNW